MQRNQTNGIIAGIIGLAIVIYLLAAVKQLPVVGTYYIGKLTDPTEISDGLYVGLWVIGVVLVLFGVLLFSGAIEGKKRGKR